MYSRYLPPITFSIIVLSLSLIVHADDFSKKQRELEVIEKKIDLQTLDSEKLDKRNKSLFADIRKIQEELVKSAKLIQNGETELSLIEEKITQESDILDKSRRSIFSKRQTISQLFAALERVALESPSRLIFYPDRPIKKIHSIMLMRSYLRTLQDRISSLNDGFEKVNNLIDNLSFQKDQLVANLNNLDFFHNSGFVIELFGRHFYRIEALPEWLDPSSGEEFIRDLIAVSYTHLTLPTNREV